MAIARNSTLKFWNEFGTGSANDEFIDRGSETIGRGKLLIDRTFPRYQG